MPAEIGKLLNSLIGVPDDVIRTDVPQRPEVWDDICGWYSLPGRLSDARARSMLGAGVEVFVRRGQLVLRGLTPLPALYKGFPLHPDDDKDPYVFRIDLSEFGIGSVRVAFSGEAEAETMAVHLDVMPLSAQKRPSTTNPRLWFEGAAGVATASILGRRLRGIRGQHRRA